MPPQMTETQNTATGAETAENTNVADITRIHTVFINENNEDKGLFKHENEQGEIFWLGEKEVERYLRVYTTRVIETEEKIQKCEDLKDTKMLEKQRIVLENRKTTKRYWEKALEIINAHGNSNILKVAA